MFSQSSCHSKVLGLGFRVPQFSLLEGSLVWHENHLIKTNCMWTYGSLMWECYLNRGCPSHALHSHIKTSLLPPELAVFVNFEVIFIVDCRRFFRLLHFSLFLSSSTLLFGQSGQIDGHLWKHKETKHEIWIHGLICYRTRAPSWCWCCGSVSCQY